MSAVPVDVIAQMPAALAALVSLAAMVGTGIWTTIKYRDRLEKQVTKPLTNRLNDLERRIELGCGHLLRAIALASKHNDEALDHELQLAAVALSRRSKADDPEAS